MRISYERGGLQEEDVDGSNPLNTWDTWFKEATTGKVRSGAEGRIAEVAAACCSNSEVITRPVSAIS